MSFVQLGWHSSVCMSVCGFDVQTLHGKCSRNHTWDDGDGASSTTMGTGTWKKIWGLLGSKAHSPFLPSSQYFLIISAARQMCISLPSSFHPLQPLDVNVADQDEDLKTASYAFYLIKPLKKDEGWMAHMRKKRAVANYGQLYLKIGWWTQTHVGVGGGGDASDLTCKISLVNAEGQMSRPAIKCESEIKGEKFRFFKTNNICTSCFSPTDHFPHKQEWNIDFNDEWLWDHIRPGRNKRLTGGSLSSLKTFHWIQFHLNASLLSHRLKCHQPTGPSAGTRLCWFRLQL